MNFSWSFGRLTRHKCPDGTTKIVYRNVDDAFPLYIQGWDSKASATAEAQQLGTAKLSGEYATKIHGLLFGLDELNQSLMMNFRGAYVAFSADPCGNADLLKRQVEQILREQHRFQIIRMQIRGLVALAEATPSNHDKIMEVFQSIVTAVGGPVIADAASAEISEARTAMKQLMEVQSA
ncbi:MAG: hypothetical protein ACKO58_11995 [Cyanobium sp.]